MAAYLALRREAEAAGSDNGSAAARVSRARALEHRTEQNAADAWSSRLAAGAN